MNLTKKCWGGLCNTEFAPERSSMENHRDLGVGKRISYIETKIWEPVPEKPCMVRVVRNKTIQEVYDEVVMFLKENNVFDELDYFLISNNKDAEFPSDNWIACYAVVGGSEGHYIHVDVIGTGYKNIFIAKSFKGFDHALTVSNMLSKVFWDEFGSNVELG